GDSLAELDVIIPRIGRSLTELGYLLLKHLATMGIPTTMTADGLLTARNKFLALQALLEDGVTVPRTVLLGSRIDAEEALKLLPYPAVLKLLTGTQGLGVLRVRDASEAASIVDTLSVLGQTVCIQEFIPHPGVDIRIFVVDRRVVGSMKRVAALHEWRTNIHLGASPLDFPLDEATERMAVRATRATGLEIAGVDVVFRDETPYVLEVNACPGYRGLLKATGVNAAEHMVGYAVQKAAHRIPA
ncbi:MAG: RimK family alpha-L-glutamate ligase, partial [Thermoplasmata archaeon]|nr:RimK family alpha-L-glutamate ligase [Thermoplasmata archaeon]